MIVASEILGPLDVTDDQRVDFPAGLLGFPEHRRFVLVPAGREGLYWLQSAEEAALAFLLVDPFPYFEGYSVEVPPADLRELHAAPDASELVLLAIVTLPRSREEPPTANLQGPLALNLARGVGKQVVFPESAFGVRCEFRPL